MSSTGPGSRIRLHDGSRVLVRPIEASDAAELQRAFALLSDLSRYRRFLTGMPHLNDRLAAFFTDIDHVDHEALVALAPFTEGGTMTIVGVARFVRFRPGGPDADFAVTVADTWQGRGLGTALLELLTTRAREVGIQRLVMDMLADNESVLALVRAAGGSTGPATVPSEAMVSGHIEVTPAVVLTGRELLRTTASEAAVAVPHQLSSVLPELRPSVRAVIGT